MNLSLTSPAFSPNTLIPSQYTCDGPNVSPSLNWKDAPDNTKSFVLIMDDPDAPNGTWDHWVLFNIPSNINQLTEGAPIPAGAIHGKNSWGKTGYGGPCPPSGTHRYFFKLYALDTLLNLPNGASKKDVLFAMKNHMIANAQLLGLYQKR